MLTIFVCRGFSQTFYRQKLHEKVYGAKDLEDFMKTFWEAWALSKGKPDAKSTDTVIVDDEQTRRICL